MAQDWYYADGDTAKGPLNEQAILHVLLQQSNPLAVPVWKDGFATWQAAGDTELERLIRPSRPSAPTVIAPAISTTVKTKASSWLATRASQTTMITCRSCGNNVSKKAFDCPHCGHPLRKPRRGFFGVIFKWSLILFNLWMLAWLISYCPASALVRHN